MHACDFMYSYYFSNYLHLPKINLLYHYIHEQSKDPTLLSLYEISNNTTLLLSPLLSAFVGLQTCTKKCLIYLAVIHNSDLYHKEHESAHLNSNENGNNNLTTMFVLNEYVTYLNLSYNESVWQQWHYE